MAEDTRPRVEDREVWRVIPGFGDKYEASSLGRVRVIATGHVKGATESRGYLRTTLYYQLLNGPTRKRGCCTCARERNRRNAGVRRRHESS